MLDAKMKWFSLALTSVGVILLLASFSLRSSYSKEIPVLKVALPNNNLPKPKFQQNEESYDNIGKGPMLLHVEPLKVELPDLRSQLIFIGKNRRPDADSQSSAIFLSILGNKETIKALPSAPLYLRYDKTKTPPSYIFSPNNTMSTLWIEIAQRGEEIEVDLKMKNQDGELVLEPKDHAHFTLREKPRLRSAIGNWMLGKYRVNGTLLLQQRAKWFGKDLFLERHGGNEYRNTLNKQKIEFGEGDELYSVFVNEGDMLVWKDNRWHNAEEVEATANYPLLAIKRIDDKVINFEIWDVEGKNQLQLNLLKSREVAPSQAYIKNFKFLSAQTRSQFVFEINNERMTIMPQDWLLFSDNRWKKLTSAKDIDEYVDRKTQGYLVIIDSVDNRDDKQILLGAFFNKSRSDIQQLELPLQGNSPPATVKTAPPPPPQQAIDGDSSEVEGEDSSEEVPDSEIE